MAHRRFTALKFGPRAGVVTKLQAMDKMVAPKPQPAPAKAGAVAKQPVDVMAALRGAGPISSKVGFHPVQASGVELAAALHGLAGDQARMRQQSKLLAPTIASSNEKLRTVFGQLAQENDAARRHALAGFRDAGFDRSVVHAVGQLPAAHGRAVMRSFMLDSRGKVDRVSMRAAVDWLASAGQVVRARGRAIPAPNAPHDEPLVDFIEDVIDEVASAISSVVDTIVSAVGDVIDAIASAFEDIVNWTIEAVGDLIQALIAAGRQVWEVVKGAVEAGYEILKKTVQGLIAIGKAVYDVLESAVNFAVSAIKDVIRALEDIGRRMFELFQWIADKALQIAKKFVAALRELGESIATIISEAVKLGFAVVRGIVEALVAIGETVGKVLYALVTEPSSVFDVAVRSLRELGNTVSGILDNVANQARSALRKTAEALTRIGTTVVDLMAYVASAAVDIGREIIGAMLDVGKTLTDMVINIAQHGIAMIRKVIDAAFDLGRSLISVVKDIVNLTGRLLQDAVAALFEIGKTLGEVVISTMKLAYRAAKRFVEAVIAVGKAVGDVLGEALAAGYQVFRRTLSALFDVMGPLGDAFEWVLSQAEDAASALWSETMNTLREIAGGIAEAIDWAVEQGIEALETVIEAAVLAGATLEEMLEGAFDLADQALETLGEVLYKAQFTVDAILLWAEKDALEGLRKVVKGMLDAGAELVEIAAALAELAIDAAAVVIGELLAYGITVAELIVATLIHPEDALDNLLAAVEAAGEGFERIVNETMTLADATVERVFESFKRIGKSALEILEGLAEATLSVISLAFSILLNWFGSYRPLSPEEHAAASLVFGDSVELDKVRISVLSPPVDLIEAANGGRPFTTMYLINFASWDEVDLQVVIHELTHVWQGVVEGPFYMLEALHAQEWGEGYNYGYTETTAGHEAGVGGETALAAAGGDFSAFNQEQQAQIVEHYWRRAFGPPVLGGDGNPMALDVAVFEPYIETVRNAA